MPIEDVLLRVRNQYERKIPCLHEYGPGCNKVIARNKNTFVTSLPDKWKLDYERRKNYCNAGLFSANDAPYKTFHDLSYLDVHDLIGECLGISINNNQTQTQIHPPHHSSNQLHSLRTEYNNIDNTSNIVVVVGGVTAKKFRNLPCSTTAGLDHISKRLASISRTIKDVKAGSSLRDALHIEDQRQGVLQVIKAPRIIYQKGHEVAIKKTCNYLPPMLPTASSKICLVTALPQSLIGGEDALKKMSKPSGDQEDSEKRFRALCRKNCLAKMKSIYAILSCLHNIKARDLRNHDPLSFDSIKAMAKHLHPIQPSVKDHQHLYKVEPSSIHPYHHYPNYHHHNKHTHNTPIEPRYSSFGELADLHASTTSPSTHNDRNKLHNRVLAAWKKKVVFVEDRESFQDPTKSLSDCIKSFDYVKRDVAHIISTSLEDDEQTRERNFGLKMEHFECGLNREKCLSKMRGKTYQIRWAEREQAMKKPEWLVLLEDEVKIVFEEEEETAEQGRVALENLTQFMYIDTSAITSVLEKLCLLVMSLPAHHLCVKQVILAFQFVSEYFLKTSPKLINKLREMRQLPPMAELHPPDYLFGMQVS